MDSSEVHKEGTSSIDAASTKEEWPEMELDMHDGMDDSSVCTKSNNNNDTKLNVERKDAFELLQKRPEPATTSCNDDDNGFAQFGNYMIAKITKLEEQYTAASSAFRKSNLFAGISIFVNGLTNPSADELKRIMMVHGGTFHHYERSNTTYIIASNLPDVKVRNMNTSKIIGPQWVVDCIRENRILDYTRYLLYTNQKTTQPRIQFISSSKVKAMNDSMSNSTVQPRESKQMNSSKTLGTSVSADNPPTTKAEQSIVNISSSSSSNNNTTATSSSVARTATDPKFLSEFYVNSRLHHIATLGASFKQYINDLREQQGHAVAAATAFPARALMLERLLAQGVARATQRRKERTPVIMHIDMDCFFVSVGLRAHPELRGKPVAVTHSKGGAAAREVPVHPAANRQVEMELFAQRFEERQHNSVLSSKVRNGFDMKMSLSEIASCSYEARACGIRNGMFVGEALKLCPDLKTLQYDFDGYKEVAYALYNTVAQYTLQIEAVSCDEMFVDLTSVIDELQVPAMEFVRALRQEVRERTGCPCSAGVGANKLQARMATKRAKPEGQFLLENETIESYMADIPLKELPGVGSSTAYNLNQAKLFTCGDLQQIPLAQVQVHVGKKFGETLFHYCRGIDTRPLVYGQLRKSVSAEVNYGIRFKDAAEVERFLRQLCAEVHTRLLDCKRKTKCVALKVMTRAKDAPRETAKFMGHGVCDHVTKSVALTEYTHDVELITRTVLATMKALAFEPSELRGIGIQLTKLDEKEATSDANERKENVLKNMFDRIAVQQKDKNSTSTNKDEAKSATTTTTTAVPTDAVEITDGAADKKRKKLKSKSKKDAKSSNIKEILQQQQSNVKKRSQFDNSTVAKAPESAYSALPADFDPEVFAALPDDIKAELLQNHKRTMNQQQRQRVADGGSGVLNKSDAQPTTSAKAAARRTAAAEQRTPTKPAQEHQQSSSAVQAADTHISSDNIFNQADCIQLLLMWIKSSNTPENYDILLLSEHARELVRKQRISDLYDPLLYMCRLLNSRLSKMPNCIWHTAFKYILTAVENEMHKVYGIKKLFLGEQLKCTKCCNDGPAIQI